MSTPLPGMPMAPARRVKPPLTPIGGREMLSAASVWNARLQAWPHRRGALMPQPKMIPRIDKVLVLAPNGKSVTIKGPAGKWDNKNVIAAFTAVVSQVKLSGSGAPSIVTCMGWVKYLKKGYPPGSAPDWSVTAEVVGSGKLQAGGAEASAWAL